MHSYSVDGDRHFMDQNAMTIEKDAGQHLIISNKMERQQKMDTDIKTKRNLKLRKPQDKWANTNIQKTKLQINRQLDK